MAITRGGRVTGNLLRGVVDDNIERAEHSESIILLRACSGPAITSSKEKVINFIG